MAAPPALTQTIPVWVRSFSILHLHPPLFSVWTAVSHGDHEAICVQFTCDSPVFKSPGGLQTDSRTHSVHVCAKNATQGGRTQRRASTMREWLIESGGREGKQPHSEDFESSAAPERADYEREFLSLIYLIVCKWIQDKRMKEMSHTGTQLRPK